MGEGFGRTPQQSGRDFETEISKELELGEIPGSGNQWYSKLDLKGSITRWSLKWTSKKSFTVTQDIIDEGVDGAEGLESDGSLPLWLIRIGGEKYDMVMIRKEDFKALRAGEISFDSEHKPSKADERRARSRVPVLLREDYGD